MLICLWRIAGRPAYSQGSSTDSSNNAPCWHSRGSFPRLLTFSNLHKSTQGFYPCFAWAIRAHAAHIVEVSSKTAPLLTLSCSTGVLLLQVFLFRPSHNKPQQSNSKATAPIITGIHYQQSHVPSAGGSGHLGPCHLPPLPTPLFSQGRYAESLQGRCFTGRLLSWHTAGHTCQASTTGVHVPSGDEHTWKTGWQSTKPTTTGFAPAS